MAVFTAIATTIVTTITSAGFVATLAGKIIVGIIATGLGMATSKLLGLYKPTRKEGQGGTKIQFPPSTDNKVARLYGRNFTGGIVIDAALTNANKTLSTALLISEYSDTDIWTVAEIFRGDSKIIFGSGTSSHIASSISDSNGTSTARVNGKIRVRVWAGGGTSAHQVFPTNNQVNAWDMMPNWTSSNTMTDLVFAIVQIDYDAENNLTSLDNITFNIKNATDNPAYVLYDYLTNTRYGAGLTADYIDIPSLSTWGTHCNVAVNYVDLPAGGTTLTHARYQCDGALSTVDDVKSNIDRICQSGAGFFAWNNKSGKFSVVVNRAATAGELANAFVLTDNNMVGDISITGGDIFNIYTHVDVEFPSVLQRDQTDVVHLALPSPAWTAINSENALKFRLDMVNDRSRAANLGNIELTQSRFNTVVEATGDYSAMVCDVGDLLKLTADEYDFDEKLFKIMRISENEAQDSGLSVGLTLLEYSPNVYGHLVANTSSLPGNSGIPGWWEINPAPNSYVLTTSVSNGFAITPSYPAGTSVPAGTVVPFQIVGNANTTLNSVFGCGGALEIVSANTWNYNVTMPTNNCIIIVDGTEAAVPGIYHATSITGDGFTLTPDIAAGVDTASGSFGVFTLQRDDANFILVSMFGCGGVLEQVDTNNWTYAVTMPTNNCTIVTTTLDTRIPPAQTFYITTAITGAGAAGFTITPSSGSYSAGSGEFFIIERTSGTLNSVTGCGGSLTLEDPNLWSYTVTNITSNCTITVATS